MSGQPLVSAISVCGPAVTRSANFGDIDEIFGDRHEPKILPQTKASTNLALSSMENRIVEKPSFQAAPSDHPPKTFQRPPASSAPKTPKKVSAPVNQKPPFLVGKAPIRNQLANQKPVPTVVGPIDNRAEIADLKRQIGELSHLLRLHVDSKGCKRDIGTDPIVFDAKKADATTSTDSTAAVCSKCQRVIDSPPSPVPCSIVDDSPEHNTSLCSQLESLAMQYLSDDQLANIAHGSRSGAVVPKKTSSGNKKGRPNRQEPTPIVETSPPKRRLAAVATATESNTISPNFGASGGVTLTRRRVMTMEQQVSIFGGGSKGNNAESLPFGFSVASQEFMHRHGVLKTSSSKPVPRQVQRRTVEPDGGYAHHYNHRDRNADYHRNYYEPSVVEAPRHYKHNPRQYHDADDYFVDDWD